MSASLQERRERVERRLEALLLGLDETVRQVYESLLERGADYDELTPEKSVARLEGFHDYIITREETGVAHPTFSDYLEAKRKFGDEMLSFGTGRHSAQESVAPVEAPAQAEVEEPEVLEEFAETSLVASDEVEATEEEEVPSFLADDTDEEVEPVVEDDVVESEEEDASTEEEPVEEDVDVSEDADADKDEEVAPAASVWDDGEDDVVIIADETPATEEVKEETKEDAGFVAPVVEDAPKEESKPVAGRINERVIIDQEFSTKLGGYNIDEIDDYLDELATFFKSSHSASEYTAKVKDIEEKTFSKKGFKKGFAINEVDDFLDTVILELQNRAVESK